MDRALRDLLDEYDDTAPLAAARTIPAPWYTDPRIAELERRAVFGRSWQLVGRAAQVAQPGEYLTAEVGGEPVVVVRGADGVLRGFFNVCRHHAAAVMTEPCGRAERLRCPYHGWTYALDGQLQSTPEIDGIGGFDRSGNGLVPLATTVWEQLVFVHLDPDPAPIEDHLGELVGQCAALDLGRLHFVDRRAWVVDCNWKVFVDNYLDGGYHIPYLHRGLNSVLSFKDYTIDVYPRASLQSSPIVPRGGEAAIASARKGRALYYWIYPNLMLNWYDGYLDTNLVVPLGVDRCRVVFDFYFADPAAEANRESMTVSARIQDEDLAICQSVQRGLGSRAYRAGRLAPRREGAEHAFHKLLAADLKRG